eukprot:6126657-Prymnesium_polylepis.1
MWNPAHSAGVNSVRKGSTFASRMFLISRPSSGRTLPMSTHFKPSGGAARALVAAVSCISIIPRPGLGAVITSCALARKASSDRQTTMVRTATAIAAGRAMVKPSA